MKHTKGEWLIQEDFPNRSVEIKNINHERICSVMPFGNKSKEEFNANAKLIAAAPELLEALIKANKILQLMKDNGYSISSITLSEQTNAINKATL